MKDGKYQAQDIDALKKSINHWIDDNVNKGYHDQISIKDTACSLCALYLEGTLGKPACVGCPVYQKTGKTSCYDTPYGKVASLLTDWEDSGHKPEDFEEAVLNEINFLRNLYDEALSQYNIGTTEEYNKGYQVGYVDGRESKQIAYKKDVPTFGVGDIVRNIGWTHLKVTRLLATAYENYEVVDDLGTLHQYHRADLTLAFPTSQMITRFGDLSCKSKGDIVKLKSEIIGMVTSIDSKSRFCQTASILGWIEDEEGKRFVSSHVELDYIRDVIWKGDDL